MTKETTDDKSLILEGINEAANIIISTMGGEGKNVCINTTFPYFTKDGVSVAKSIKYENKLKDIGARLIISACDRTVQNCGDGTTLTALLTKELINYFHCGKIKATRENIDKIDKLVELIINEIDLATKKEINITEIENLATTAAKSKEVGKLFKEIYTETSKNAAVEILRSVEKEKTYYTIDKGLTFNSGFKNAVFVNTDFGQCILEDCYIFLFDKEISDVYDIEEVMKTNKNNNFCIIANDVSDALMSYFILNKTRLNLNMCIIETPGFNKESMLENLIDIGCFVTNGKCDKIVVNDGSFTIYNEKPKIANRIKKLQSIKTNNEYYENELQSRVNRLNQSITTIYVGGKTNEEQSEEYDRIEDALKTVQSSLKYGYCTGAGITLYNISKKLKNGDVLCDMFNHVLYTPIRTILHNAELDFLETYKDIDTNTDLYDVKTNKVIKQKDDLIIDSNMALKEALLNAIANFKLFVTTKYYIINEHS